MSEENAPITVTMKGGAGFEAPWLVIRGNRPDEVANMLSNLGNLPEVIAQQASLFAGTVSAGPVLQQAPPVQQEAPAPQAAWGSATSQGFQPAQQGQQWNSGQQAPPQQPAGPEFHPEGWNSGQQAPPQQPAGPEFHPEGLQCQTCGGRVQKKNLTRKSDGKAFSLWTCPNQRSKGDGHFSEFAN